MNAVTLALLGLALLVADPKAIATWGLRGVLGLKSLLATKTPGAASPEVDPALVQTAHLVSMVRELQKRKADQEIQQLLTQILPRLLQPVPETTQ